MTVIRRGQLGNRRNRSRRADEAAALAALDPARAAELEELRRYNPQGYRKELRRLVRDGVIPRGRGWETSQEALDLLAGDLDAIQQGVAFGLDTGDFNWRTLAGLAQAEAGGQNREPVLAWLSAQWGALEDADDRAREAHIKTRAAEVEMRKAKRR